MADRTPFQPYASQARVSSPAQYMPSEYWEEQPVDLAYTASSPEVPDADAAGDDWIHQLVVPITAHPKFDTLFSSIKSCLELDHTHWKALSNLREDPDARRTLEFTFSVLYHVPPDDVWRRVAHLRQEPAFSDRQTQILAEVENAYCRKRPPNLHEPSSLAQRLGTNRDLAFDTNGRRRPGREKAPVLPMGSSRDQLNSVHAGSHRPPLSPARSVPSTVSTTQRSKQAPIGWRYFCPSFGCKKDFRRKAHYCNHLRRNHPDFGLRHPHHVPQMSLRSIAGTNPSDGRHTVRFQDQLEDIQDHNRSASRSFPPAKRSQSSRNSTGVRSPGVDQIMDDSVANHPGYSQFEALMLDENNVLHMGGGTLMPGMNMGSISGYYPGPENI